MQENRPRQASAHGPHRHKRSQSLSVGVCCLVIVSCTFEATADRPRQAPTPLTSVQHSDDSTVSVTGAFGGTLDGQSIYEKACASCHEAGFNGAPRPVASDWPYARDYGLEHYTRIAAQGVGIMPARGGYPDLTDAQLRAAMNYLFVRMGVPAETAKE